MENSNRKDMTEHGEEERKIQGLPQDCGKEGIKGKIPL